MQVMKVIGLVLMISGWFLVVAAIALLRPGFLAAFAVAGMGVEVLGLVLLARSQAASRPSRLAQEVRR